MTFVGAIEASAGFSTLLDRAISGEEIVIIRSGVPVAKLVRVSGVDRDQVRQVIARLKTFSEGQTLDGLSVRALRDEGRR